VTQTEALVAVLVVVVATLVTVFAVRHQRSRSLRSRFGPEYDRTLESVGDEKRAEKELSEREERRRRFQIHDLEPELRARYWQEWREVQSHFVDEPQVALREADVLLSEVMRRQGYPMDDFDQSAADVSVDHPREVEDYRKAHAISVAAARDEAGTEDMRLGVQHYRALFASLLGEDGSTHGEDGVAREDHLEPEATRPVEVRK
jgi:hypothetical protein